jgi:hypothetical protein
MFQQFCSAIIRQKHNSKSENYVMEVDVTKFPIYVYFGSILPSFTQHRRRITVLSVAVMNKEVKLAIKTTAV